MTTDIKPQSKLDVEQACRYLWGSLVLSGIALLADFDRSDQFPQTAHLASIVNIYAFLSLLIIKIAVGRNWARYTSLIITIFWLPFGALIALNDLSLALDKTSDQPALLNLASPAAIVTQIMGLWLIFTKPGKEWFKRKESSYPHAGSAPPSLADKLTQLQELREKGLIDQEDFDQKRAELLAKF